MSHPSRRSIVYAFLGHGSAVEAMRALSVEKGQPHLTSRWPESPRPLPSAKHCITTQKQFRASQSALELAVFGVTSKPVDLLVSSNSSCSRGPSARFHIWSRNIPTHALYRLSENVLLSGPEMIIMQLCGVQARLEPYLDDNVAAYRSEKEVMADLGIEGDPAIDDPLRWEQRLRIVRAAVLACEFAGTYRLPPQASSVATYRLKPLMSCASLWEVAQGLRSTVMESRTLRVADIAFDNSGSPMETALALMLTLPVDWGGFGLPRPQLNAEVDVSEYRGIIADRDVVSPDLLWNDQRIALEYDSAEKHGRAGAMQLAEDALRSNILVMLGYRVLRVTPGVIATLPKVEMLARQIAALLGVALEQPNDVQALRRRRLYLELMPRRD